MKKIFSFILKYINVKFLLILIVIIMTIFVSNYSFISIKKYYVEKKDAVLLDSIGKIKIWDTTYGFKYLGIDSIFLRSKFLNGKIYYRVGLQFNKDIGNSKIQNLESFILNFTDKDKFTLFKLNLEMGQRTDIVDSLEKVNAIRFEGSELIDKNVYSKFDDYFLLYRKNN